MFVIAAACVTVGLLAFVLGMRYGVARNDGAVAVSTAGGVLDRLDRQAARLKAVRAQERTALSFHDALSGPARAPKRPTPAPLATTAAPPAPATTAATVKPGAAAAPPAAPAAPDPGSGASSAAAEGAGADEAVDPDVAAAGGESAAGEDDSGEAEDDGDALPAQPASHFSLQVGAFPNAAAAEALAAKLTERGYRVRIVSAAVDGKGTWYRVRVGAYDDRASAETNRTNIADKEGLFALVVPER